MQQNGRPLRQRKLKPSTHVLRHFEDAFSKCTVRQLVSNSCSSVRSQLWLETQNCSHVFACVLVHLMYLCIGPGMNQQPVQWAPHLYPFRAVDTSPSWPWTELGSCSIKIRMDVSHGSFYNTHQVPAGLDYSKNNIYVTNTKCFCWLKPAAWTGPSLTSH